MARTSMMRVSIAVDEGGTMRRQEWQDQRMNVARSEDERVKIRI